MMKRNILILLLVGMQLIACTAVPLSPSSSSSTKVHPLAPSITQSSLPRSTKSILNQFNEIQSSTLKDTPTITPTLTSTLDINAIRTATKGPAAICPNESTHPAAMPDFIHELNKSLFSPKQFSLDDLTQYVNQNGVQPLLDAYDRLSNEEKKEYPVKRMDLTNDGVPELLFGIRATGYHILKCEKGKYEEVWISGGTNTMAETPELTLVSDVNRDGIPEMVLKFRLSGGDTFWKVVEWDGQTFKNIIQDTQPQNDGWNGVISVNGWSGDLRFEDLHHNGILSLVIYDDIPMLRDAFYRGFPWRKDQIYYEWNGTYYVYKKTIYAPPQYRFQAVQDGDRATVEGRLDAALDLYQQVIFGDRLDWWSSDRRHYLLNMDYVKLTLVPPTPDPHEYEYQAAYSLYRILLLHVERGYIQHAQTVLNTLRKQYTPNHDGYVYTQMAETFWQEYQKTHDLSSACQEVVALAKSAKDAPTYLGMSVIHGAQTIDYERQPEMYCPFGAGIAVIPAH
jgi:hypothetical protein